VVKTIRATGLPTNEVMLADASTFEATIEALHSELTGPAPDPVIAGNLLENWLRRVARDWARPMLQPPARLLALRAWMDQYSHEPLRPSDLAKQAGISAPHLSSEFRRHFGVSPIEYLIRQRLARARYLLRDQNLSIGEIARQVGYDDVQYFSKLFRRRFDHSPRAMRNILH
jgi:transcriptional regulator GlxA family with amidase domain